MQILPSMTVSSLKLYAENSPWDHEVCLTVSKGWEKRHCSSHCATWTCSCEADAQGRADPQGLSVCGSGRVLSSAGQSLALSPCMPVNVGTDCGGKCAAVAVRAPAVLQLQMCCDRSDRVHQHQLTATWCPADLCDLDLLWIVLFQDCQHIGAENNDARISVTAA